MGAVQGCHHSEGAGPFLLLSTRAFKGGYMTTSNARVYPTGGGGAYDHTSGFEIPPVAVYSYLRFIDPSNGDPYLYLTTMPGAFAPDVGAET